MEVRMYKVQVNGSNTVCTQKQHVTKPCYSVWLWVSFYKNTWLQVQLCRPAEKKWVEYFWHNAFFCQQLSKLISGTDATDLILYRQEGYFNYVVSHEKSKCQNLLPTPPLIFTEYYGWLNTEVYPTRADVYLVLALQVSFSFFLMKCNVKGLTKPPTDPLKGHHYCVFSTF